MKSCTKCNVEKALVEFYKDKQKRDGKTSRCKECIKPQTKESGIKYHVDHIIPVSRGGLHCYLNLQILTATENLSKGCKIGELL